MGIYGALATAVSGLRAQAFALENISGNIANSQTTGYKRIETTFIDLIPDAPLKSQVPGAVLANSRATNNDKGDIISSSSDTYMALNGSGFFVVEQKVGQDDGNAVFGGASYYTRRGDFDTDREGFLVNGAGYYLKGLDIDATTGNISGSVPGVIQISNAFLAAQQTTRIDYELNLPEIPLNGILDTADFTPVPADIPATATGTVGGIVGGAASIGPFANDRILSFTAGGVTHTIGFHDTNPTVPGADFVIDTSTDTTIAAVLASMETQLQGLIGTNPFATATVGINAANIEITLGANTTDSLELAGTGGLFTDFALGTGPFDPVDQSLLFQVPFIQGQDNVAFTEDSISGGALTVYSQNGASVDVQFRWAKVNDNNIGTVDRWNLFYLEDGSATGTDAMWRNTGQDYDFVNGVMSPNIPSVTLTGLTVNGITVGDVELQHGGAVTQYARDDGLAQVTTRNQNGYGAGEYISVTINDAGRVVASYSNGQQIELAQVVVAQFNAANSLKRLDGGLFAATSESGEAILDNGGGVIGGSLESSNTDISEEFTKLIVTQQAYAAGTRIVSTANDMLQEALNMVR